MIEPEDMEVAQDDAKPAPQTHRFVDTYSINHYSCTLVGHDCHDIVNVFEFAVIVENPRAV
jgi:hypothetical protein